jgi:hypothetical protein
VDDDLSFLLARDDDSVPVLALPIVVGAVVVWSFARYLREADELQRGIQLNALALGFGVTFIWVTTYTALQGVGALKLDLRFLMSPGFFVYLLGVLYGRWHYR